MNYPYSATDRKHLNFLIQERLNKRFSENRELLGYIGGKRIYDHDNLRPVAHAPVSGEYAVRTQTMQNPYQPVHVYSQSAIDHQQIYTYNEPIRQSITIPAHTNTVPTKDISLVISDDHGVEERVHLTSLTPPASSNPKTMIGPVTAVTVGADIVRETTTIVREYPSQQTEVPRVSIHTPTEVESRTNLAKTININTDRSADLLPLNVSSAHPKPILKHTTNARQHASHSFQQPHSQVQTSTIENVQNASKNAQKDDFSVLIEENKRVIGQLSKAVKERDFMESSLQDILEYLDLQNSSEILPHLKELTSKLSYSEGRQISLSEEKKTLELDLERAREDIKKLTEQLKTQEAHKNREMERLTNKGNVLQERMDRIIASLKTQKPVIVESNGDQIVTVELPVEAAEESNKLQAEVESLKAKLVQKEHEYFVKENELLQKSAALEMHYDKLKEEMTAANQHIQMAHLKNSLDKFPKEKHSEELMQAEFDSRYGGELERVKSMLRTTTGELEKSRTEASGLVSALKSKSREVEEQEVKLFEACLRVAFLSAEIERLRAALPYKH